VRLKGWRAAGGRRCGSRKGLWARRAALRPVPCRGAAFSSRPSGLFPRPHFRTLTLPPTLPHTPLFFSLSRGSSTSARACPPPPSPGCRSSRPRA
jgi:hypothetical protein